MGNEAMVTKVNEVLANLIDKDVATILRAGSCKQIIQGGYVTIREHGNKVNIIYEDTDNFLEFSKADVKEVEIDDETYTLIFDGMVITFSCDD